ncbi:MAG: hypothetical protein AB7Q42_11720 [Acidimicrobiia bacterium]
MLVVCWSVKGGSGTTVVAAALSLLLARSRADGAIAVDLGTDLPAALGLSRPIGPGLGDWIEAADSVDGDALLMLASTAGSGVDLIAAGRPCDPAAPRWDRAAAVLADDHRPVVVDAGSGAPPAPLVERAMHSLLVIRPCYLALRQATELPARASGIILVAEPGRALGRRDVESAVGVPVIAEVPVEPAVARAVDAGLLSCRLPVTLAKALRTVA